MSTPLDRLLIEALQLPSGDRAALAHSLIASLDDRDDEDPTDVELGWLAEYRRGEVQAISSADMFAKARALLGR